LIAAYRETVYEVRLPGGPRTALRVGQPVPDSLRAWTGRDWPLIFITACNPNSVRLSTLDNRVRMRELVEVLQRQPVRWLVGAGLLVREAWREPSLLVAGLTYEAADRLAVAFGQNAVLVADDGHSTALRIFRHEWRSGREAESDIQWAADPSSAASA
jgi:hypothetical protein